MSLFNTELYGSRLVKENFEIDIVPVRKLSLVKHGWIFLLMLCLIKTFSWMFFNWDNIQVWRWNWHYCNLEREISSCYWLKKRRIESCILNNKIPLLLSKNLSEESWNCFKFCEWYGKGSSWYNRFSLHFIKPLPYSIFQIYYLTNGVNSECF